MWQHEIIKNLNSSLILTERLLPDYGKKDGFNQIEGALEIAKNGHFYYVGNILAMDDLVEDKSPISDVISLPHGLMGICYHKGVDNSCRCILAVQEDYDIIIYEVWKIQEFYGMSWWMQNRITRIKRDYSDKKIKTFNLHLDKNGNIEKADTANEETMSRHKEAAMVLLLLNKILSCKNVYTEKEYPNLEINKKLIRRGDMPRYSYHILKFKLPNNPKHQNFSEFATNNHNRIHFCRGHFKEYTSDNPLFGKHTGLYWWEPHVRGQNTDGFVDKDYEVRCA